MIELPPRFTPLDAGKGGMSSVLICNDERLQRPVIVKYLDPDTEQGRLIDEIQALQAIRSPYVVQIYDVITSSTGDIRGVVEEYCPGNDLSDWIGQVDVDQFVKFGLQLISGIAEIHDHDLIHRDIKPHNVRIGNLNRLTIIDFGLARAGAGAKTVSAIGTSGFMAPELFRLNANGAIDFTTAIDIFAFASSLYLLAAGNLPRNICQRPPVMNPHGVNFHSLPFPIDIGLANLLNACLSENCEDRPSATVLRSAFRKILVRNKHRALLNIANDPKYLDANNRRASASLEGLASVVIEYDGDYFFIKSVSGDLYVNAGRVGNGYRFPGSCVIAFGRPELGSNREYITFDVSHPGVVI